MTHLEGNVWNGTIPAFGYCNWVNYTIIAEDEVGNIITTAEIYGYQYQYHVIPEFPSLIILPLFLIATLLAVIVFNKKRYGRELIPDKIFWLLLVCFSVTCSIRLLPKLNH